MRASIIALTVVALGTGLAGKGAAMELDQAQLSTSFAYGHGSRTRSAMQGVLELEPRLDVSWSQRASLTLSGRIRFDVEDQLDPGKQDLASYSRASRPRALGTAGMAELRDGFLEYRLDNGLARLGKQQIVWGRLDGVKVLDTLNPQDFREFILDDFDDSRISLWSAYLDVSVADWRIELAWLPDPTGYAIPRRGAWFELTAPRFRYGAGAAQPTPPLSTSRPSGGLGNSAAGLRLSRGFGGVDVSAVAYSGLDFEPLGRVVANNANPFVERFYERRNLFGVSAETSFGAIALRAEYAWQPARVFNTRSGSVLDTIALDQHRGAVAMDISAPFDILVNLQYLIDVVENAPQALVRPERDRIATVFLRRSFAYERLNLELRWYRSLKERDDISAASLAWDFTDNTEIRIAAEFFNGRPDGLFGQFDGRDRLVLGVSHTF
jgi:hypothetical protein